MKQKYPHLHVAIVLIVVFLIVITASNKNFTTQQKPQKIKEGASYEAVKSGWKKYANSEIGLSFTYPDDFAISNERHIPTDEEGVPYEIDLSLVSPKNPGFRIGTFATGFEGSEPTDIPPKDIVLSSGQTITREVYAFSPKEYHIITKGKGTPWFVTSPFPNEKLPEMIQLSDAIIASFEVR